METVILYKPIYILHMLLRRLLLFARYWIRLWTLYRKCAGICFKFISFWSLQNCFQFFNSWNNWVNIWFSGSWQRILCLNKPESSAFDFHWNIKANIYSYWKLNCYSFSKYLLFRNILLENDYEFEHFAFLFHADRLRIRTK